MKVLVTDLEATCWRRSYAPDFQSQEIIEIGRCIVDTDRLAIYKKAFILCRPTRSKVSEFCVELTGIPKVEVEDALSVQTGVAEMYLTLGEQIHAWASWGDFDRKLISKHVKWGDFEWPFSVPHINLKLWYALDNDSCESPRGYGMERALADLGLELEGSHHRAGDDAYNIARIFVECLKRNRTSRRNTEELAGRRLLGV